MSLHSTNSTLLWVGPTTCKLTTLGEEYVGTLNTTETGLACQAWTAQSPHVPESLSNSEFPDGSMAAAENYCRNPDSTPDGPWCYTMDPSVRWQYCCVPFCCMFALACTSLFKKLTELIKSLTSSFM